MEGSGISGHCAEGTAATSKDTGRAQHAIRGCPHSLTSPGFAFSSVGAMGSPLCVVEHQQSSRYRCSQDVSQGQEGLRRPERLASILNEAKQPLSAFAVRWIEQCSLRIQEMVSAEEFHNTTNEPVYVTVDKW